MKKKGKKYKDCKSFNKSLGHLITDITGNKNLLNFYQLIKDLIYLEKGIVFKVIKGDISNPNKDDLEHDIEDSETEEDLFCKDHTN